MAGKPSSIKGQKRKQVLSDHKKVGKKLIPPLYQHIPSLHETWFRNDGVPEIIWIAALLKDLGTRSGIEVVEELTDIPLTQQITPNLAVASGYYDLPEEVMRDLQNSKVLQRADVTAVLRKLSRLFPEFPMKFMTPTEEQETIEGVQWLRATMEPLYIKTSKPMVLALATSVHIALATGKLRVCFEGSKLDRMNALSEYPDSEESRAVAAVVRSSFHILYGPEPESHGQWARAFWNRCWELGNCDGKA